MLCVTEVKVVEVDREEFMHHRMNSMPMVMPYVGGEDFSEMCEITHETITGQRFINERGSTVCIGISSDAQDVLGLPFTVFEQLQSSVSRLDNEVIGLRTTNLRLLKETENFKAMSLFGKIKYHFRKAV